MESLGDVNGNEQTIQCFYQRDPRPSLRFMQSAFAQSTLQSSEQCRAGLCSAWRVPATSPLIPGFRTRPSFLTAAIGYFAKCCIPIFGRSCDAELTAHGRAFTRLGSDQIEDATITKDPPCWLETLSGSQHRFRQRPIVCLLHAISVVLTHEL